MVREPLCGYMLTWTTYGAWLHGDERGSYNRKAKSIADHEVAPNPRLQKLRSDQLKNAPVLLDGPMRKVVRLAIEDACAFRDCKLLALNVRTNHVHVVLPLQMPAKRLLHDLKARATRALRDAGLVVRTDAVWTSGGSTSLLYGNKSLADAIEYVVKGQGAPLPEA
ncbi:MAG: transposase [Planctomycetes bacterium]|nr:transposase [Planctomycetota bacterium]